MTAAPLTDHDAIDTLIDWAETHPDEHNQQVWAERSFPCGTVYCIAGRAALEAGEEIDWDMPAMLFVVGGETIPAAAQRVLGLSVDRADRLFAATNTIADLRQIARQFRDEDEAAGLL